jgi:hypothetical protein
MIYTKRILQHSDMHLYVSNPSCMLVIHDSLVYIYIYMGNIGFFTSVGQI